jgi:hypothetical protein
MDRQTAGRLGGLATRSRHDSRTITEPARRARWERYLDRVDPDRVLPEDERIACQRPRSPRDVADRLPSSVRSSMVRSTRLITGSSPGKPNSVAGLTESCRVGGDQPRRVVAVDDAVEDLAAFKPRLRLRERSHLFHD